MQMQSWSVLLALTLSACGFGGKQGPDAGPGLDAGPPPDGDPGLDAGDAGPAPDGGAQACRLDLDASLAGTWDPRFTIAGFTGPDGHAPTVYDFARDVDGSIVAAGEFGYVGRARVEPLMRLRDGAWQPARTTWELTPPGSGFSAVAIASDGKLALATYDDFGPRAGEIWLDDGSGLRVIGTFEGLVRRLHWYRGKLWVAGWHQVRQEGKTVIQGLAVWDGTGWSPPPGGAPDGFAFELVEDGDDLLVGGAFTRLGGITARSVAAFNGTTWRALSFGDVSVYALARAPDGELYAGGAFGDLGAGAGGLARWTGRAWVKAAGGVANRAFPGVVTDLTSHAGGLYVAGCFHTVGGAEGTTKAVITRDVARLDSSWHALDDDTRGALAPWLEPLQCGDEGPSSVWNVSKQAMFSAGDQLLLGGSFPGVAGELSQAVIAHAGETWRPQGPTGLGLGGAIDRIGIAAATCEVWGTGQLSHVAGVPTRARVVRFTGTAWEPITDDIPVDASCLGFAVSATGEVALGCTVFSQDDDAVGRIYRVAGDHLVQVGGDQPPVQAVAYDANNRLWIAGGGTTGFLARLDGAAFTTIEDGFDAPVLQLDIAGTSDVIAAGTFTKVGALDASRIARWDGTTWRPLGAGLPGMVTAIARHGTRVYASTFEEGNGAFLLGEYDGTTWKELATPASGLTPVSFFNFNAIQVIDGAVIAVGSAVLDDRSGRGALVYRDGRFTALGGGVHAIGLSGLAVSHEAIWVAGIIAEAGAAGSTTSTVGIARYVITR
jgi:hypothetical protein